MTPASKPELRLYLLAPRGYCAGVARAIEIVEAALVKWGAPVYVRHEIVHNQYVVRTLRQQGAIFVDELDECPEDRPVVLSAHGVSKGVHHEALQRNLMVVDAVCPLVSKVHVAIQRNKRQGLQSVMIGHAGHPETIGTLGQLPEGEVLFVETVEDAEQLQPDDPDKLAYVTQTTLSVDETERISSTLSRRFPSIRKPHKSDICYATTNRQNAVKKVAPQLDALFVVGSPNSSNSNRMVEVGQAAGCSYSRLVATPECIAWDELNSMRRIGLTAGASAPEVLLQSIKAAFEERFDVTTVETDHGKESVVFNLPKVLRPETVAET